MPTPFRVAVIQAEPVYLDMMATIEESCRLSAEAAAGGAKLVAFPDRWAPGYPPWIWARPVDHKLYTRYVCNALPVESEAMDPLPAVSTSPRPSFSPQGEVLLHRRKIKSTHMERTIFGDGSGNDFDNVAEIYFGPDHGMVKVGCLASLEHTQPLLKYHTISQGEKIHVAMWPPVSPRVANEMGRSHPILWD
ncbi:uncharacterized protein PODANS_5_12870 [Podospora anserina S mat+]|uniref:nitrilase n=1 Tax=Podospora anserina (strain S / ATCC MYA-4624 / DSM 980 / FGSC 10383) TaxID=515849 RepID=B2AFF7_PODAN|nr:uncharacterized protein PODANS_5_12870 [Podospora anserina S mat+]CAP62176.1 unnamed protein product [Podospora anserina S mat+]